MGRMKELAIDQVNRDLAIEQQYNKHIERVYQAGLPLWMANMYSSMEALYEEVDNQNLENTHILTIQEFKNSETGENYCAYWGNWEDAYEHYLNDKGFYQQQSPDQILDGLPF